MLFKKVKFYSLIFTKGDKFKSYNILFSQVFKNIKNHNSFVIILINEYSLVKE